MFDERPPGGFTRRVLLAQLSAQQGIVLPLASPDSAFSSHRQDLGPLCPVRPNAEYFSAGPFRGPASPE